MAHIARLVDQSGTVLKNLNDGVTWALHTYSPKVPDERTTDAVTISDGGERPHAAYSNVSDTPFRAWVTAATADALRDEIRSVNAIFARARAFQELLVGTQVFFEFQPDGATSAYRSEIFGGRVDGGEDFFGYEWVNKSVLVTLNWTRRFYWEGPETELSVSNANGSGIGGINVYNCNDSSGSAPNKRVNTLQISGASVLGDLPAACRIEMFNGYATNRTSRMIIAQAFKSSVSLNHILEGEAGVTYGSNNSDVSSSGGFSRTSPVYGTSQVPLFEWALSTATLNNCLGNYFAFLTRFTVLTGGVSWLQMKLFFELTEVAAGPQVFIKDSNPLQEIGALQLPPFLLNQSSVYPLVLRMYGRTTTGTQSVTLDFLQLTPLDGRRILTPKGYGLGQNARLTDDGLAGSTGIVYTDNWSTAGKTPHYSGQGGKILLRPGIDQRLFFLCDSNVGSMEIARYHTVRVYYRPRVLTV